MPIYILVDFLPDVLENQKYFQHIIESDSLILFTLDRANRTERSLKKWAQ